MYSSACIVNAVSLTCYTFTISKVIVMRITLHGGASNKIKNGIGSNGPNVFLFIEEEFKLLITFHTTVVVSESLLFFSELCFHLLLISIHNRPVSQPMSGRVLSPCQAGVYNTVQFNTSIRIRVKYNQKKLHNRHPSQLLWLVYCK